MGTTQVDRTEQIVQQHKSSFCRIPDTKRPKSKQPVNVQLMNDCTEVVSVQCFLGTFSGSKEGNE